MKFSALLLLLTLALTTSGGLAAEREAIDLRVFAAANASQIMLVTFHEPAARRMAVGPRMNHYQARGYDVSTWSRRVARDLGSDYGVVRLAQWPITELTVHCVVYLVADGRPVDEVVSAIAGDPRVADAQAMMRFDTHASAAPDPYFELQANLHQLGLERVHQRATGHGVRIAVIDTGVDLTHPDLAGQFDGYENFATAVSPGFDGDRHGTAVAGIIGARAGNGTGIVGVAPGARLLAYKACWPVGANAIEATCNSFTLALALNEALRVGVDVINLSLSGPRDPLLESLLDVAAARGVIVVAADGGDADGSDRNFPASLASVIGVRARGRPAAGAMPANVLSMPGLEILSTLPSGGYDFLTGCSFSAAQVSGMAALARQLQPTIGSADVLTALRHLDHEIAASLLALARY